MNSPRRILAALLAAIAVLLVGAAAASAAHKPHKVLHPPAKVRVGRVAFVHTPAGRPALLVAIRYPIQAAGRAMWAKVRIAVPGGGGVTSAKVTSQVSAGFPRRPDRRRTFTFVHQIALKPALGSELARIWHQGRRPAVRVVADGKIDVDRDGRPELSSRARARRGLQRLQSTPAARPGTTPLCATVPVVQVAPGERTSIPLPACTTAVRWSVKTGPTAGSLRLGAGDLVYSAPHQPGTEEIRLDHARVVIKVTKPWEGGPLLDLTAPAGPVVRAIGDSVTAGFGYYSDGSLMPFLSLYECKPVGTVLDDACSSNSTATKNGLTEVPYAPDYGLSNNISWAAQWANEYGVTNYKNYSVSGSEPVNWAPGGSLYATTQKIEAEDPDYILMTIGANPILADTLFGLDPAACAFESDIVGGYSECVEEAFESVHLRAELKRLYTELVEKTDATIYLMQYHLSIPSSALAYSVTQIAQMGQLMNETIAAVAKEVNSNRLQVVAPPHFNVGVSLEPIYPSSYTCSYFEYGVDGPSVQSTPTQDELEVGHYLSFCDGPQGGGEPWVISADTGIHPSAVGYAQMAGKVPAPAP